MGSKQALTGLVAGTGLVTGMVCGCGSPPSKPSTPAAVPAVFVSPPPAAARTAASVQPASLPPPPVSPDDVITWTRDGRPRQEIVENLRSTAPMRVYAADENRLRDAGVSEDVIEAMKATARR
jgi:hypothetical protein